MEETVARIRKIEGNLAHVEAERIVCARCQAGTGCGAGLLTGDRGRTTLRVRIPPRSGYSPGDRVRIAVSGQGLLRGMMLGYGLPLAGLLAGTAIAALLLAGEGSDLAAVLAACSGLAVGVVAARLLAPQPACPQSLDPVIVGPATTEVSAAER